MVYGRPPLVLGSLVCAIAVMWNNDFTLYLIGTSFLIVAMSFDLVDSWFAARFLSNSTLANLADRIMDKIVYSTIFPLVAVGMMWRLTFIAPDRSKPEMLHAILVLVLCIIVIVRNNIAHFIRSCAINKAFFPENKEFTRLRTMVASPVVVLLYIHAFYLPGERDGLLALCTSWLASLPLRSFYIIEIILLIINFGSIAALGKKYGNLCLDEVAHEDDLLRWRILSFFPNTLSVLNALMGVLAVLFAYQGLMRQAYLFLIGAAIFDKLDGALARKLGLTEPSPANESLSQVSFGGILDDIADAVSFCLAPALIFFMVFYDAPDLIVHEFWIAAIALLYFLLGIARLIYFTLDRKPISGFFKGMPTPAAALLIVAPVMLFSEAVDNSIKMVDFWEVFSFVTAVVASLAMNLYPVHYLHIGRFMDRNPWFGRANILLLIVALFSPYFGYIALLYLILYLLSPILTRRLEPIQ